MSKRVNIDNFDEELGKLAVGSGPEPGDEGTQPAPSEEPSPGDGEEGPFDPEQDLEDGEEEQPGGVQASTIEVEGVIIDAYTGKTWAVPTDQFEDNIKIHTSPYDIPKDPNFHYEAHSIDEVADMESQGFVKVTRREVARELFRAPGELASPLDTFYVINGAQVMMKIPKVYADRRYAQLKKICDFAVEATQPPPTVDNGANNRVRDDNLSEIELEKETTRDIREALRR
jgi:hypothetical protein